jgi:peptidoglycan endopeptidase LytE
MGNFLNILPVLKKLTRKALPGTVLFSLLAFPAAAEAAVYNVLPGDTLYGIGLKYGVSAEDIQRANGITGYIIYPGQQLVIPDQAEPQENSGNKETPSETPSGEAAQTPAAHIVAPGECLYSLAIAYGTTVEALMKENGLSSTTIYPGQKLLIPAGASSSRPAAEALPSRSAAGQAVKKVLSLASSFLGTRYVYGGSGPSGFDCSGFVRYVFQAVGFNLPHDAEEQAGYGKPVDRSSLQPGDLVFFSYYGSPGIGHVGIYTGQDRFIHASSRAGVIYSSLNQDYYRENYKGARRLLTN